ncbi:Na+/H+ antiporter [Flavobacterium sp. '19STA2R22 D10 B1']|uniref:Na+/H+ antiporter n=1 Tax=Flavobacterium aerium TaxID=3037261 RepID=UPI00278C20C5|nr:Na+/H+ antiporter [Flavobacterium sp. '19STA2R22 D10 B1']
MHNYLLLSLGLIVLVSMLVILGERLRISYPIFLVLAGLVISYIPGIPSITIDPEVIFLIFLPPLLFEAAFNTEWKSFWKWKRIIGTFAFGLVILTSGIVALVSTAMIPGFTLSLGFLLGGIVSPPDAVAATSILKRIKIPKTMVSVLEGESLVNDASSLIVFQFALVAVLKGTFVLQDAIGKFFIVTFLGIAVGLGIAYIFYLILKWLPTQPQIDSALSLVVPYLMYIAAEEVHASGVMAVVSGGLFLSHRGHEIFSYGGRIQAHGLWSTLGFVLNGVIFILIGLELPVIVNGLGNYSKTEALTYGLIITFVIIVVRIAGTMGSSLFTMFISRFIRTNNPRPGWKGPLIVGWAGMRGVVSLASALSIPLLLDTGELFPQRNLILFITFVVIITTLILHGLTLPILIRWVNVNDTEHPNEAEREVQIHLHLLNTVQKTFESLISENNLIENKLIFNLQGQIANDIYRGEQQLQALSNENQEKEKLDEYNVILIALIDAQRRELSILRREKKFDELVIRKQETAIDLYEEKIKGRE